MGYRLLTTLILALHFGFLAYVVTGGFLAWRWPRTIWLHLTAAGWGFLVIAAQLTCPLTWAEDWSRRRAGGAGLSQGFIDRYIENVIYPERFTAAAQALVVCVVAASWAGLVRRHRTAGRETAGRETAGRETAGRETAGRLG